LTGQAILVGGSAQRVEKISDLDMTEQEYIEAAFSNTEPPKFPPFADILSSAVGLKRKKT
jgi:hypothetical protein